MKFEEIINKVKQGVIAPIYFLYGDEPYFIDKISDTIQEHALKDEERGFNEAIFYGKDTDVINLVHSARSYPMGAPRQLIIVREAQYLDRIELMESYFKTPLSSTVLVINYKYKVLDKRTKIYSALSKQERAVLFDSKKIYDNQVGTWIGTLVKERGLSIEPRAQLLLAEFLGSELEKIVQAVDKLVVAMGPGNTHITVNHVAQNIGVSKEYTPFELQSALINRDLLKANRIVKTFASNAKSYPLPVITSTLFSYFSKLLIYHRLTDKSKGAVALALKVNPFFVDDYVKGANTFPDIKIQQIISLLRECDVKGKGFGNVSTTSGDLLKELVFKILH